MNLDYKFRQRHRIKAILQFEPERNGLEPTIELRMTRDSYERLIKCDHMADDFFREYNEESQIRQRSPALQSAYLQYKVLLELSR